MGAAQAYTIRLRVENCGRSVARNCEAKITKIFDMDQKKVIYFDPVPLRWVVSNNSQRDLCKSEYDFLYIVQTRENDINNIFFKTGYNLISSHFPRKNYIFEIVLYGENVGPYFKSYRLEDKRSDDVNGIQLFEH